MQIVIDIDDKQVLFDIKNQGFEAESETDKVIINALYNGTPLPKGHGRLIDADELKKVYDERITYLYTLNKKDNPSRESKICATNWCGNTIDELPTIIEADKNITYQPVNDYKECNFYKDGKEKDLSEVDISKFYDYYKPPYRDNPFREGAMSGLWGEYEYYCPKCNLEITKVFYDNEHIRVGDCSKCPKCKESD